MARDLWSDPATVRNGWILTTVVVGVGLVCDALGAVFLAHAGAKAFIFTFAGTAQYFEAHGFPGWTAWPVSEERQTVPANARARSSYEPPRANTERSRTPPSSGPSAPVSDCEPFSSWSKAASTGM